MSAGHGLRDLIEENEKGRKAESFRRFAWVLGLMGLFPFYAIAVSAIQLGTEHGLYTTLLDMFRTWAIVVLAFMGGVRWGFAISNSSATPLQLWPSIIVPGAAWMIFFLPANYMILCLLVCYCALGAWDSISANNGVLPIWYGKLRIVLTFLVAISCVLMFISLYA